MNALTCILNNYIMHLFWSNLKLSNILFAAKPYFLHEEKIPQNKWWSDELKSHSCLWNHVLKKKMPKFIDPSNNILSQLVEQVIIFLFMVFMFTALKNMGE